MLYNFIKLIVSVVMRLMFRIHVSGLENIPSRGGCILCANHISNFDPLTVGVTVNRKLFFMAKEEIFRVGFLGKILRKLGVFPVRRGEGDISAIKTSLKILRQGNVLVIYPEGTRVRTATPQAAKSGVALIAAKSKSTIIPVGIQANYKFRGKVKVNIGAPIRLDEQCFEKKLNSEQLQEISEMIMSDIRRLACAN